MQNSTIPILYQDDDLVAVYKPAGVKVHRAPGDGRHQTFMLQKTRELIGRKVFPVHRLDQPTSGVLLFALTPESAALLAERFRQQSVFKAYAAIIRGALDQEGTIDYPLVPDAYEPKSGQAPKPAKTLFKCLATVELPVALGRFSTSRYSLAAVYPRTGRMHQIRRHFHHISHPIIGDTSYGDGRHNRLFREMFGCHQLLLTCLVMAFRHPRTEERLLVTAPFDPIFLSVAEQLGWGSILGNPLLIFQGMNADTYL